MYMILWVKYLIILIFWTDKVRHHKDVFTKACPCLQKYH